MIGIAIGITLGLVVAFNAAWRGIGHIPAPPIAGRRGHRADLDGIAIRLWGGADAGALFPVTVTVQDDHRLIDTGPYRHLSNPSYSGAMLRCSGSASQWAIRSRSSPWSSSRPWDSPGGSWSRKIASRRGLGRNSRNIARNAGR
jgi:protein-S-isoprenylcysteine O-methyltransferase Ste14